MVIFDVYLHVENDENGNAEWRSHCMLMSECIMFSTFRRLDL